MIMIRAAFTLLGLLALAAIDARPSVAEVYRPWCVDYPPIGTSCTFTSYEQCMMTAGPGTGGWCVRNPWYSAYGEGRKAGPAARGKRHRRD
jgi:hypothetical protein